jgi:hypothetical protein
MIYSLKQLKDINLFNDGGCLTLNLFINELNFKLFVNSIVLFGVHGAFVLKDSLKLAFFLNYFENLL